MQVNENTYEKLRNQLTSGEIQPGQKLVTRNLAKALGVSLGPVREAIQRLASEGLVKHIPGAGAIVPEPSRQELEDLYVLRDATESCAAGLAARHISRFMLEQLDEIVDQCESLAKSIAGSSAQKATQEQLERWLDLEEQFHEVLISASHNDLLAKVIRDHRAIERVFGAQRGNDSLLTTSLAEKTCRGKRELIAALRDGDGDLARQLMSRQIQEGQAHVLKYFDR